MLCESIWVNISNLFTKTNIKYLESLKRMSSESEPREALSKLAYILGHKIILIQYIFYSTTVLSGLKSLTAHVATISETSTRSNIIKMVVRIASNIHL